MKSSRENRENEKKKEIQEEHRWMAQIHKLQIAY